MEKRFAVEFGIAVGSGGDYKIEPAANALEALAERDRLRAEGYGDEHTPPGERYAIAVELNEEGEPRAILERTATAQFILDAERAR